jgi:protoporphyrinogen oxidase
MKYTILGGGISGLSAAHYLTKFASTEKVIFNKKFVSSLFFIR